MRRIRTCLMMMALLFVAFSSPQFAHGQQNTIDESVFAFAAPEQCWIYSSWSAQRIYDAASENHTQRLLAEPEIRAFIDDLIKRAGFIAPAMMSDQPEEKQELVRFIGPKLVNAIFTRSGCFFMEEMKLDRDQEPESMDAVLLIDAGEDANPLATKLSEMFSGETGLAPKISVGGLEFRKFTLNDEPKLELFVGSSDDGLLLLGIGEESITRTLQRINKKEIPAWLKDPTVGQQISNVTNRSYFNVQEIRDTLIPLGDPEIAMAIGFAGFGNIDSVESCTGFSGEGSVNRILIRTNGRPEGIFDLSSVKGLESNSLQQFPADSLYAFAVSIDPNRLFRFMQLASLQMRGNGGRDFLTEAIQEFKEETGIDLRKDIAQNLGDSWTVFNGRADGWMAGTTMTAGVKDAEKLRAVNEKLVKKILLETAGDRFAPTFRKFAVDDNEVFSMSLKGMPFPVEPSWCISDDQLIVALYPQAIRSALKGYQTAPLVDQAEFALLTQPFGGNIKGSKLMAMAYTDTPTQFELSYPYLQMMLSMSRGMIGEISEMSPAATNSVSDLVGGIQLPPARTIHRHLQPSWFAVRQTEFGIELETHQTIPALDVGYIAPLAVGMILPAVQQVRLAARRTQSMNNMRQQVLASLNYESAYMQFPAGYSTNNENEKLLSWRVHVLPFIEQNNLYDQFNLDEPWDSPHNKPLAAKMPDVFRSPVSNAEPGMTVYRGIGGERGVLGAPRKPGAASGVGFGNITDGSSNTIFLVETSDQLAVPWTKPDDGLNPEDFNLGKIFGMYPGGTNIAMCDGSVQFASENISEEVFRFLMEMNDGNVVPSLDDLHMNADRGNQMRRNERVAKEDAGSDEQFKMDDGSVELTIENMLGEEELAELENRKRINSLREIGLAFHNFESAYREFPSAYTTGEDGTPLLSWRVHLLPFLDQSELYEQFHLDEPWDSQHNRALLNQMPEIFVTSAEGQANGMTSVLANGGPQGFIRKPSDDKNGRQSITAGVSFAQITDGTSYSLMLLEAPAELAVEWTKPTEFVPTNDDIKNILGAKFYGILGDGSSYEFPADYELEKFKAVLTTSGGEIFEVRE